MGKLLRPGGFTITSKMLHESGLTGGFVIDACCGEGDTVEWLSSKGFTSGGIDINGRTNHSGDVKDICQHLGEGIADGVICECAFSLLSNPNNILSEFNKTLKQGGVLMMSDLYLPDTNESVSLNKTNLYTKNALQDMLFASHFEIKYFADFKRELQSWVLQSLFDGGGCFCNEYDYKKLKRLGCSYYALTAKKR